MNIVQRPTIIRLHKPQPDADIVIIPVYYSYKENRYEAWAKLWFDKGIIGRTGKIILEDGEFAVSTAIKKITNTDQEVDGWKQWRYEDAKGAISLDEFAGRQ